MRLNKFLAHAGVASRRKCDEIIASGKVKINDEICTNFSFRVTDEDCVRVKGEIINLKNEKVVYLFNKPKGVISSVTDDRNRTTVMDYLPNEERLFPIGRLDRDTTGVLLISNDGELANKLTHPRYEIEKVYTASTYTDITKNNLQKLKNGIQLEDGTIARGKIFFLRKSGKKYFWMITLKEGKKREVKRIITAIGSKVVDLHRESFAGLSLGNLKVGKYRRLKKSEIPKV
ncbi:MAG: pseudouridine synthase [Candidatus Marinimicrobia bacterium]|nr:pseudouridine synthase [Candidatus Neomarinimicrobiota bacterium]|tara:strand:+ start:14 stop:706 length:693 start_codon:yes stop_codon:yes gene_type:complete